MGRSPCCDENGLKKGPWSPEEDQKLVRYIQKHGHGSWRALPKLAGLNRCGKSCRLRWTNYLRPDIKRGKFSTEEEQTILNLHSILGNKWSTIATHLAGRTDNEIKNFWNTNLKKKLIQMGFDPMTHRPRSDLFATLPHLIALANLREAIMDHHYSFELHQQQPISSDEAMQLARAQYLHYLQHSANNTTFTSTSESSTMTDLEAINILNSSPALSPSLDSPPALSNINNANNNLCQSPFCLENGTTIPPPQLPIDDTPYIPAMQDVQFYQTALSEEFSQIRPSFEAFSPGEAIAAGSSLASTPSLLADDFTSNMQGTLIPSFWPELLLEEPFYSLS